MKILKAGNLKKFGFLAFFIVCAVVVMVLRREPEPVPLYINKFPPLSCPQGITEVCIASHFLDNLKNEQFITAANLAVLTKIPDSDLQLRIIEFYRQLKSQERITKEPIVFLKGSGYCPDLFQMFVFNSLGRSEDAEKVFQECTAEYPLLKRDELRFGYLVWSKQFSEALKFGMNMSHAPYSSEKYGVADQWDQIYHWSRYKLFKHFVDTGNKRATEASLDLISSFPSNHCESIPCNRGNVLLEEKARGYLIKKTRPAEAQEAESLKEKYIFNRIDSASSVEGRFNATVEAAQYYMERGNKGKANKFLDEAIALIPSAYEFLKVTYSEGAAGCRLSSTRRLLLKQGRVKEVVRLIEKYPCSEDKYRLILDYINESQKNYEIVDKALLKKVILSASIAPKHLWDHIAALGRLGEYSKAIDELQKVDTENVRPISVEYESAMALSIILDGKPVSPLAKELTEKIWGIFLTSCMRKGYKSFHPKKSIDAQCYDSYFSRSLNRQYPLLRRIE